MSAGLFGLLDDVATMARMAAASADDVAAAAARASAKAAGVVVDDTAVTPQYVAGVSPDRELPIIKKIAIGSLRNKLLFILPAALLLSQFLPWLLTPILMCGGAYLCFEGAEKIWARLSGHHQEAQSTVTGASPEQEKTMVKGAIRTDFILSAEIMVIALNEVSTQPFVARAAILIVVAIAITLLVYGFVGILVKMDDIGLALIARGKGAVHSIGRFLVAAMPKVLATISVIGIAAMLWVGGHLILVGAKELGLKAPYDLVHHLQVRVADATGALGAVTGWLVNTAASAVAGLIIGAIVVVIVELVGKVRNGKDTASEGADANAAGH